WLVTGEIILDVHTPKADLTQQPDYKRPRYIAMIKRGIDTDLCNDIGDVGQISQDPFLDKRCKNIKGAMSAMFWVQRHMIHDDHSRLCVVSEHIKTNDAVVGIKAGVVKMSRRTLGILEFLLNLINLCADKRRSVARKDAQRSVQIAAS